MSRFVIDRQLGRGQAAQVCVARDLMLNRSVALKLFLADDRDDALDEIKVVNQIAQQTTGFIPNYYGTYMFDNGMTGICMSIVDGVTLRVATVSDERKLASSLYSALSFLHLRDVAHRDINPTNVLVKRDGTACLIDFNWAVTKHDCVNTPVTSVNYISPEYLFYNMATDLWYVTTMNDVWGATVLLLSKFVGVFPWMTGIRDELERHWLQSSEPSYAQIARHVRASNHPKLDYLLRLTTFGAAPIQTRYAATLMKTLQ